MQNDKVMDYLQWFVQTHKLDETINQLKPMATRTFTNSQKIRLRLKVYWDKNDTGYDDFEDFYSAFTDAVLDNLEFLATLFDL